MICTNCAREIKGEVVHIQTEFVVAEKDKEKKMGYNTTVLILNDFTGSISKSEKFVERLCQMLSSGEVGRVIPGVEIIETHHADDTVTVRVGGNRGVVENVNTFKSPSAAG